MPAVPKLTRDPDGVRVEFTCECSCGVTKLHKVRVGNGTLEEMRKQRFQIAVPDLSNLRRA